MKEAIVLSKRQLPATVDELADFVIVGNEAIQGFKAKLRACTKSERAHQARKQALNDGRKISRLVIDAEIRLGELLEQIPRNIESSGRGTIVTHKSLPIGINKKESFIAQTIARNPDVVEEVFQEKSDDIPTRHDILKKINHKKHQQEIQKKSNEGKTIEIRDKSIDLRLGDFRKTLKDVPDGSIDLILTDPPYPKEYLGLYKDLSELASRKLKPNGFCITYAGHIHLPIVMQNLGAHLNYYWTCVLLHSGQTLNVVSRNMIAGWKPILIYQKGFKKLSEPFQDVIQGTGREKEDHDWEQAIDELSSIIIHFSQPGDIILDPMAGSGTTLLACKELGRRSIGVEIDEQTYNILKKRLRDNGL